MAILGKEWKFWNLLVRRRRPLWSQWRPLCGFGNFEKKIKILEFFPKILKIWKILNKNFQSKKQILTLRGVYCIKIISNTGSLLQTDNRIRESKQNPDKCNVTTSDKVFFLLLNSQEKYHVLTIVLVAAKRFPSAFHEVIPAFQAQVTVGRVDQSKLQRQRVHPSTCRSDYWYQAGVLSLGIEGLEQGTVYVLTWGQCLWWMALETHNLKTTKTVAFLGITPKKQKSRNPQTRALTKMRRNAHLAWRGADRRPTSGPYNDSEWGGCK